MGIRSFNISDMAPSDARIAIRSLLMAEPTATRKVYAALAHKVWGLLIVRDLSDEVRDWHALILDTRSFISEADLCASERLVALSDLLRESISLAETSPPWEMAARPRARRILRHLVSKGQSVPRSQLLESLEMGGSNLSNVLTQLVAHSLIERTANGKEAHFRITPFGREIAKSTGEVI